MTAAGWRDAGNLLCIRLDYLGDVLMMTPAIRALKRSRPGRRITLMTSPGGAAVARYIADVDAVISYPAPWLKSSSPHPPDVDLAMARTLRAGGFDGAVIFTTYSQSALPAAMLCYLAGIPLRLAHCRENPYQLLTDWIPDPEPHLQVRHEVRRQLDLVEKAGCRTEDERLSMQIPPDDLAAVCHRLESLGIDGDRPWIVLHPGATAPSRRYPPQRWREVAQLLAERLACPLVFTGSQQESMLVDEIRDGIPLAISLAGKLGLGELAALISMAPVLVANNTGPAHIGAAVGTPVVDLYALTNPQHTPWQVPSRVLFHDVPCRNCYKSVCPEGHHACLANVAPARVADAAIE
ncbi:MAG TPA: glycosyltransferase family 9 protein, partial [Noviherbaspirillum sp.]|uniref:glycosyltransferase family 9 protein n=1 Tax=Noviherbaspirillum sp. TaxID=1926288 RepID=UPI002DDCB5AE